MSITIKHRLLLALYLRDTATGKAVNDRLSQFFRDGEEVHFQFRGEGVYILLGEERENFHLEIRTTDYMVHELEVDFADIPSNLPLRSVQLIPNKFYSRKHSAIDFDGTEANLVGIDGIQLGITPCYTQEYNPRKRILTLSNPNNLQLDRDWYALVNEKEEIYEVFEIEKKISSSEYKLKKPFETDFNHLFAVYPVVFGWVGETGDFHFTARDEYSHAKWIFRYTLSTGERYETVDFRLPEEKSDAEELEEKLDESS